MAVDAVEHEAQVDDARAQLGVLDDLGLAERAAQRVELVDEVVEQHPAVAEAGLLVGVGQRRREPALVRGLELRRRAPAAPACGGSIG